MNTARLPNPSNPFGSVFSLLPENSSADQTAELQLIGRLRPAPTDQLSLCSAFWSFSIASPTEKLPGF
jgi:hypothetical protein